MERSLNHADSLLCFSVSARCALVTGGARGLGLAIATRLAAAMPVLIADLDADAAERAAALLAGQGRQAVPVPMDVRSRSSVVAALEGLHSDLRPDVLVNNAGVLAARHSVDEQPGSDWDEMMSVNLKGAFHTVQAVVPEMVRRGYGRIVNITSVGGQRGSSTAGYAASKAGLLGFTKAVARDLTRHGVTCNAVSPGWIATDMAKPFMDDRDLMESVLREIPAGRVGRPEEVASAVAYLVSDDAAYITGAHVDVNGGMVMD
jgi:NAD(P)-dependent dehydrogenase (short-subunit alcohol dehydrogenase family)